MIRICFPGPLRYSGCMISAVIFDFDGVIADSERLHLEAFNRILNPMGKGFSWQEYVNSVIGFDDRGAFRHAIRNVDDDALRELVNRKAQAFQDLLGEHGGAAALPGAVELIRHLSGSLPIAICSGALLGDILPVLASLGIESCFQTIVTADDTSVSKPNPAPYRLACERLGIRRGVMAIEDTPAGIRSAKGAGLRVLAVTNSYPSEALNEADAIVDTLEGLTLDSLQSLGL